MLLLFLVSLWQKQKGWQISDGDVDTWVTEQDSLKSYRIILPDSLGAAAFNLQFNFKSNLSLQFGELDSRNTSVQEVLVAGCVDAAAAKAQCTSQGLILGSFERVKNIQEKDAGIIHLTLKTLVLYDHGGGLLRHGALQKQLRKKDCLN